MIKMVVYTSVEYSHLDVQEIFAKNGVKIKEKKKIDEDIIEVNYISKKTGKDAFAYEETLTDIDDYVNCFFTSDTKLKKDMVRYIFNRAWEEAEREIY